MINSNWQGEVAFYELFFGTPLAYWFLVVLWEHGLRRRLPEWRYLLLTYLAASFFIVNHYFQHAPFYQALLFGYTGVFLLVYYYFAVRPSEGGVLWKSLAVASSILFTIAFILFENIARYGVAQGCNGILVYVRRSSGLHSPFRVASAGESEQDLKHVHPIGRHIADWPRRRTWPLGKSSHQTLQPSERALSDDGSTSGATTTRYPWNW